MERLADGTDQGAGVWAKGRFSKLSIPGSVDRGRIVAITPGADGDRLRVSKRKSVALGGHRILKEKTYDLRYEPKGLPAVDKAGVTPLHRAVRTRCAAAVKALLEAGADPRRTNGSGSTPMLLATRNNGRGGRGSPEAKEQQEEILRLLEQYDAA